MSHSPDISVILLNWNVRDLLRDCLRSIYADLAASRLSAEVIVVDCASTDGSAEMVASEFPQARSLASGENLGYSRGNNAGLRLATGRLLLLLNPDTQVLPGALLAMAAHMDAHPRTGAIGPQLLNPDGTVQSSRRRLPNLLTGALESTWLQSIAPRSVLDHYYARDLPDETVSDVDWVVGAAIMIRREVYEEVGGLDEGFFMYSEELDWCRRIRDAGWGVQYVPSARIVHFGGQSSEQVPAATHIRFQRSKLRYFEKYHGRAAASALRLILLLNYASQLVLEAGKWVLRHKPAMRSERLKAYWQVLRSGLG